MSRATRSSLAMRSRAAVASWIWRIYARSAPVMAVLETPSVGTVGDDAADDPAVWASASPVTVMGQSTPGFVAGTDKKSGLYIYGFDGRILQFMPEGLLNNVDLVQGLTVGGKPQLVLGASDRTPGKTGVALYLFDPAGTGDNGVRYWGSIATDVVEPYGFCFGKRGDEIHAVLVGHEGELRQFVQVAVVGRGGDGIPQPDTSSVTLGHHGVQATQGALEDINVEVEDVRGHADFAVGLLD